MTSFFRDQSLLVPSSGVQQLHKSKSTSFSTTTTSSLDPLFRFVKHPTDIIRNFTIDEVGKQRLVLQARLKNAKTHDEWLEAATLLDQLDGNNTWKSDPESPEYDASLIRARLQQLEDARISGDIGKILFLIRTTLTRHLGGMGNVELYRHSYTGTKYLIEAYIETTLATLETLITAPPSSSQLSPKKILESLIATRQSFGRTALLLSGGATFGMNHVGVLKALWEADLLPRIISGASAGSIVASVLCVKTDEEIPEVLADFPYGDLDVFENSKEPDGVFARVGRFLKLGAWIDIEHLMRVMRGYLGDMTFQEAYNRTRRILNICVSPASVYELPQLLNYLSAPNVLIWSAVAASCSVPFLFSSASLLAKNPKTGLPEPWNTSPQKWIDGSVDNDLPMTRLAEMFNVNHFIVSQVNPHVVPFLEKEPIHPIPPLPNDIQTSSAARESPSSWKSTVVNLAMGEALHRMNVLAEMGVFTTSLTKARSVLSQKYAGDITIFPEVPFSDIQKLITNPTPEFMINASLRGERATWPRLSRIRNCCAIELALDRCIHKLRTKVVFSGSQIDLRLNTIDSATKGKTEGSMIMNGFASQGRNSNISRKRPASGDPNEFAGFVPPNINPITYDGSMGNRISYPPAVKNRGRSQSTGPALAQITRLSPAISRTTLGAGKGYFEIGPGNGSGSPTSLKSSISGHSKSSSSKYSKSVHMFPLDSVKSPQANDTLSPEIHDDKPYHGLKRTGSRFRLVRQTPSSELDPADAEDESAAIAGSSEDEDHEHDSFQLPESMDDEAFTDAEVDMEDFEYSETIPFSLPSSLNVNMHMEDSNDNSFLHRRPLTSLSSTALPTFSTYLPNDELYSSRANSRPSSLVSSPVATVIKESLSMTPGISKEDEGFEKGFFT